MEAQGKQNRLVPLSISLAVGLALFKSCIWEKNEAFNSPAPTNYWIFSLIIIFPCISANL